jgi:hypothetical protein
MNSFPLEKVTVVDQVPCFWVVVSECVKCKKPFALGELALACGPPQYSILHLGCAPTHNFFGFPHSKPLIEFYKTTKEQEFKNSLEYK